MIQTYLSPVAKASYREKNVAWLHEYEYEFIQTIFRGKKPF